ncbi:hypothetical protein [Acetobacter orientalis]|uniref:hypothetical protein n=1 Tax=Acetobacter orientalis TaxID=146474 RepID=UPI00386FCAC1
MAAVIGAGLATLHDLKTHYDSEDLYLLLEVASVQSYNRLQATCGPQSPATPYLGAPTP